LSFLETVRSLDAATLRYVQEHFRGEDLSAVMVALTRLGDLGLCWLIPAGFMLRDKKTRRRGAELLACVGVCCIVNNLVIKNIIDRTRPFDAIIGLETLVKPPRDWSFPSGHSAAAFASAYAIAKGFGKKLSIPAYALAAAIAATRVGVGVHYPTDVIVGAGVGTALGAATLKVMRRAPRRKPEQRP
jgi:undecaprenyl-diphosphatase